jgi:hypothetical protein
MTRPAEPRRKTIFGPEAWREIAGVTFVYWDRWLLRLALDEPDGLDGLVRRFEADRRSARPSYKAEDAESKLSHLDDLRARLSKIATSPREALGIADATDKQLLAKARTKLIEKGLAYKSRAMLDTPRRRLEARALRGHWDRFPASPARFERELKARVDRQPDHDWRQTMWLAIDLDGDIERIGLLLESEAEQMALRRAALSLIVESMERVDDSGADLASLFDDVWNAYLAMPWERTTILPEVFFRDLIELAIWESYGLISTLGPFFRTLAPDDVTVLETVFADVVSELRDGGFARQEERALKPRAPTKPSSELVGYGNVLGELAALIASARRAAARSAYGEQLLERLVEDLSARFGRGFSRANVASMRLFYLTYRDDIVQTLSGQSGRTKKSLGRSAGGSGFTRGSGRAAHVIKAGRQDLRGHSADMLFLEACATLSPCRKRTVERARRPVVSAA